MNYFFANCKENAIELEERYYRLKYLYLIDVDSIVNKLACDDRIINIIEMTSDDTVDSETLFHIVFDSIFKASKPYNIFLSPNDARLSNAFFGELDLIPESGIDSLNYTSAMRELMYIALRNHCIIHGFFHTKSNDTESNVPIEITGKNHLLYDPSEKKTSTIYQRYTTRYNAYHTQKDAHKYSHQILENMRPKTDMNNTFISCHNDSSATYTKYVVPKYLAVFALFLFNKTKYNIFDKYLLQIKNPEDKKWHPPFIQLYSKLFESVINYSIPGSSDSQSESLNSQSNSSDSQSKSPDPLSFYFPMEFFYGFSTFGYIAKLLEDTHNRKHNLYDLEGTQLLKVIKQLSSLPNAYSRHFFLKYAIEAVTSTNNPDFFLETNPNAILEYKPQMNNKDFIQIYGFARLSRFFKSLSAINIPMLEDLWVVVLHKLLGKKGNEFLMKLHSDYVENNYSLLSADFTQLTNQQISLLYNSKDGFDYNQLKININNLKSNIATDYLAFSTLTRERLEEIMIHYFDLENLNPATPPLYANNNMSNSDNIRLTNFINEHRKPIFNYLWK